MALTAIGAPVTAAAQGLDPIVTPSGPGEGPARRRAVVSTGSDTLDTLRVTSQATGRGTAEIVVEAERYTDVGSVVQARSSGVAGVVVR